MFFDGGLLQLYDCITIFFLQCVIKLLVVKMKSFENIHLKAQPSVPKFSLHKALTSDPMKFIEQGSLKEHRIKVFQMLNLDIETLDIVRKRKGTKINRRDTWAPGNLELQQMFTSFIGAEFLTYSESLQSQIVLMPNRGQVLVQRGQPKISVCSWRKRTHSHRDPQKLYSESFVLFHKLLKNTQSELSQIENLTRPHFEIINNMADLLGSGEVSIPIRSHPAQTASPDTIIQEATTNLYEFDSHIKVAEIPERVACNFQLRITNSDIPDAGRGIIALEKIPAGDLIFSIDRPLLPIVGFSSKLAHAHDICMLTFAPSIDLRNQSFLQRCL